MTSRARMDCRAWSVWAAAGLIGAAALPASAQIAANNGGGRALDANNQVGSGGTNRIENQVDYAARNDLITGNVAGGFGFQDSVGYSAPGAFLGGLQSDSLFSFRAASLGSDPLVAGVAGAGTVRGGNVVVFDDFTSIPSSRSVNTPTTFAPTGGAFRVNRDYTDANPLQFTLDRNANQTFNNRLDTTPGTNTLGVLRIQDGSALAVTADPLTGVRRQSLNFDATPTVALDPTNLNAALGRDFDSRLQGFDGSLQDNIIPTSPLNSNNLFEQGPADNAGLRARNEFTDATGLVKPSLQLGQLTLNNANASAATLEQRVRELQESIFGPAPAPGNAPGNAPRSAPGDAPEENAYTKLLEEIREQSQQSAAERNAELVREGIDPRPEWMRALDEPTEDEIQAAEGTLEATMQRIRQQAATARGESAEGGTTGTREGSGDAGTAALGELMSDLSYNVRLETLVAAREGRVNTLFAEAEAQMAAGQFLNAERTYRQIRIEAGDNPLGLAGLIHAQLGAGMVRSAAFNLRSLFEDHPELIATRYGQNLLPPQDRLEWLQKELQRMIDAQSGAIDPGLMMAYLGYQIESRPLVRQGLAIAQNASPIDPLLPVLRSIWLDQKPGEGIGASK